MIVIFIFKSTLSAGKNVMPLARPIALSLAALALATPAFAQQPLRAVTTIGMIGDVAANVGGECISVTTLMGPGIDPHLYQATARDVQTLNSADVILYAGYGLEGQLGDVLNRFSERVPTLAVAPAAIPPAELIGTNDLYGVDPHLWMDASRWAKIVPVIASQLSELAPECAQAMAANAATYGEKLTALHDWTIASIASIPKAQRILVTAHDAFAYYGDAYGIEVAGIQGISTQSEAGIADIRETAELIINRAIPAVFVESTINPRTIQAVIEAAAQAGHGVVIGGELYSDAMGDAGTVGGTYLGMIYENTLAITEALGGTLPPLPGILEELEQH